MKARQPVSRARAGYDRQNQEAADIILSDTAKYGGPESLPVTWARAYLARVERDEMARIGPLFRQAAA